MDLTHRHTNEQTDDRTHHGHNAMTITRWPLASGGKNGRKLSKRVENTVGKGEIARYEQFLLFPQCFQKTCFPGASKGVIEWEWVKAPIVVKGSLGVDSQDCLIKSSETRMNLKDTLQSILLLTL